MIGLLLLYFIIKYYGQLAARFGKKKWPFALLGVVTYYFGAFVGGILLGLYIAYVDPSFLDSTNDILLSLIALPIGIGCTVGLFYILKSSWTKKSKFDKENLIDELEV